MKLKYLSVLLSGAICLPAFCVAETTEQASTNSEEALTQEVLRESDQIRQMQQQLAPKLAELEKYRQAREVKERIDIMEEQLSSMPKGLRDATPRIGVGLDMSDRSVDYLVIGSPADKAGIQIGDFILSVNGQDVSGLNDSIASHDKVMALIQESKSPVPLVIQRGAEKISLSINKVPMPLSDAVINDAEAKLQPIKDELAALKKTTGYPNIDPEKAASSEKELIEMVFKIREVAWDANSSVPAKRPDYKNQSSFGNNAPPH